MEIAQARSAGIETSPTGGQYGVPTKNHRRNIGMIMWIAEPHARHHEHDRFVEQASTMSPRLRLKLTQKRSNFLGLPALDTLKLRSTVRRLIVRQLMVTTWSVEEGVGTPA